MLTRIFQLVIFIGVGIGSARSQALTPEQYIAQYKDIAIREMKRMGVPAAISLAQGLLETESGNSDLVRKSNNHFGIKCKSNWTAGGVTHDDDAPGECFRTYKTAEDSYRDHSNFLRGSERYAPLFQLDPSDYKGWAYGLKKAGYATNPKYPNILIRHIEQYNLQQYSLAGAGAVPKFEREKYTDDPVTFDDSQPVRVAASTDTEPLRLQESSPGPIVPQQQRAQEGTINGCKYILAKKGTSLLAIASQYRISLQKLLDMNDLGEDGILEADQVIFLQKKLKTGERDYVIVQKDASLYDVAQENGIQLQSLLDYNQLNEDGDVARGTKLYLREATTKDLGYVAKEKPASASLVYQVQPKESLYGVARKYSVTVQQLKEWNNLTSDELKVGQQLIVGK